MKILMTGATGLIGSELGQKLNEMGHSILVVTRSKNKAQENLPFHAEIIEWDLNTTPLKSDYYNGVDVIINLAGDSIDGRWTAKKKKQIFDSRVQTSTNLLINCPNSVKTIITASAQGYYGERGNEELSETSAAGLGFLAEVCKAWEAVYVDHQKKNPEQRLVILRLGVVLSKKGGALRKLISIFQRNLGAVLGCGTQWMSYISLNDLTRVLIEAIKNPQYSGVLNACNNAPVNNREFTKALCEKLRVISLPRVPSFALKIILGEMSELVLGSAKMNPFKLNQLGFKFEDENLISFLEHELKLYEEGNSVFYAEQFIPYEIDKIFDFFSNHENLEKITPAILNFHTEKMSTARVELGTLIDYKLKIRGVPIRWRTLIDQWDRPVQFVDTQLKGPYKHWSHTHKFKKVKNGTLMIDEVRYKVPLSDIGNLVVGAFVEKDVNKIFAYRRQVIAKYDFNL
ncbi:TIGR01777 family oxidoreductase [bacterium]|nr:TIGR01777 family oxidoreductase [bacterium]